MPTSSRNRSIDTQPARHRLCALLAVGLLIAQVLVWWAPADQVDAATSGRTRLSTGVPDAVAPQIVAVGRTLHSVWADAGLFGAPGRGVGYRRSLDGGTTWESLRQVDLHSPKGHAEWPRVAADGDVVAITWSETTSKSVPDAGNRQIWATVSTDAGRSFGPPFRVDSDRADSETPTIEVQGDDIWIAWGDLDRDVYVATSHDRGATFELDQLEDGWGSPVLADGLAVDGDTVAVTWMRDEGERNKDIDVRVSRDGGDSWGPTVAIADTANHVWDWYPVAAVTGESVHVSWSQDERRTVRTSLDGGANFLAPVDLGRGAGVASVTARRDLVALAWADATGAGVQVATSTGVGTWSQTLVAGPQNSPVDIEVVPDQLDERPEASFTWTMPERFGMDRDGDGLVDERDDEAYVTPPLWTVHFDGCASTAGGDDPADELSYAWTLDGEPFGPDDCRFSHEFGDEGEHTVRLEVTGASGRTDTTSHVVEVDDLLIFSIGDSVASGEGNPDIPGSGSAPWPWSDNSRWQDRQCNRTAKAGPALAAADIEQRDPRQSVTFVHLACSGATVWGPDHSTGGLLSPYEGINPSEGTLLAPQLDQLEQIARGREVDAVFISIGANDLAFSKVVAGCLTNFGCYEDDEDIAAEFDRRLADLPLHYEWLDRRLEELGIDDVYITEYFDPTVDHRGAWNLSCTANLGQAGLSDSETRWAADHVMGNLNGSVREAALRHGWHFVGDIAERFHGHGYCAEDPYVVQLGASFMDQSDKNGAFHPNNAGHEIYGERIADEFSARRQPPVVRADEPGPTTDDWSGDLYLSWGDREVLVTTLRADGGAAIPVRTVDVADNHGTYGTRFTSLAASREGAYVAWDESDEVEPPRYTGHWHAYAAPAVQAAPDLALTGTSFTQGPDGADFLVAGKSTAVHAEVVSTLRSPQTVYVRYRIRDRHGAEVTSATVPVAVVPGHNDLYLRGPDDPLVPTEGSWWAEVELDPDDLVVESDDENNTSSTEELDVRTSRGLRTLYVPVAGTSCATATGLANLSSPWLHAVLPVADGALTQHSDCGYAMPAANGTEQGIAAALTTLEGMALLSGYDTAVGVVPGGWLQGNTGGAVGLGLYGDSAPSGAPAGGILVEQGQGPAVIAHEIGHNFGLEHQADVPASGYWVAGGTQQDGVDLMDAFTQQKPWVAASTWSTLMTRFQLTHEQEPVVLGAAAVGEDDSIVVRGTIAPDGTVEAPAWYETEQAPDVALGSTSELSLEYRGADDTVLATAGLNATLLEGFGGDGLVGWSSFGARVPWVDGAARLVLRDVATGSVLVDRAVSAAAPTATLTSPTGTTWAAIGGELDIRWTASDADGTAEADLRSALSYSTDGGVSFKPIAMDVQGTQFTWSIGDHLAGKPVQVRVEVTDGVRTTAVVSETFTVGGTLPSGEPRVAVVRNVQMASGISPFTGLHTMRPDGSDLQQVPVLGSSISDPRWSPDGQRIAYVSDGGEDDDDGGVYTVLPDGSEQRFLTPQPSDPRHPDVVWRFNCPQWHPDGTKVLVHAARDEGSLRELAWAAADGSGLTTVATGVPYDYYSGCPQLSSDGARVTFRDDAGIQVLDLTSGLRTLVLAHPTGGYADQPWWTPDGNTVIATVSTRASSVPANYWGLVRVPLDGSGAMTPMLNLSTLQDPFNTGRGMDVHQPRFTPDGNQIVFHSWDGRVQYTDGWRYRLLCTMNADGTGISCLQDEQLSELGGGFLEGDLAPGGSATPPPPPPPWTDPAPPVAPPRAGEADAGGPYEATEDQPTRLDAGASTITDHQVPLAEWDLDGDGEFDDATGLHPTVTFPDPGTHTVRVRLTTLAGSVHVAQTTATVSATPPVVMAPTDTTAVVGRPHHLDGASYVDAGTSGHSATASWGDGTETALAATGDGGGRLDGEHTWTTPGTYTVDVTVCDVGTAVCATSSTTVTVLDRSRGDAPVAADREVRTASGAPVRILLDATDPEGDPLDRSIEQEPRHGRLVRVVGDTAEYVPAGGFTGIDSFTWTASDGESSSAPATVTIVVGNSAPTAADDRVDVDAGERVLIPATELLADDVDPDGDELELVGAYGAAGMVGAIERTDDGIEFTAPEGPGATTTFEYAVADGRGGLDLATVTVVIAGELDPGSTTTSTTSTTIDPSTTSTTVVPSTSTSTTAVPSPTTVVPSTSTSTTSSTVVPSASTSTTVVPSPTTVAPSTSAPSTTSAPSPSVAGDGADAPSVAADSATRPGGSGTSGTGSPRRLAITGVAILPLLLLGAGMVVLGLAALRGRRAPR